MTRYWLDFRNWLCARGAHWPIRWDEEAIPAYLGDPPMPPEEDFCCQHCGHVRPPYRWRVWAIRERLHSRRWSRARRTA